MLTYLLLSGPGLKGRERAQLDEQVRAAAPEVLIQIGHCTLWSDDAGACLLWTWESATEKVGGSHVQTDERGVLALAGSAWSRTSWETAASLAQQSGLLTDPAAMRDALTGSYSAVLVSPGGQGFVTADATGTGHVYLARGIDIWAASNRAPLAAIGLQGRWAPDVESQAWMAMLAIYAGTDTSVKGVELLPAAAALKLHPGRVPNLEVGMPPWEAGMFSSMSLDDALDEAAHALTEQAAAVASTTAGKVIVNLSGGKDSRLVLAAFTAARRAGDIQFRTMGQPGAADREVAVILGQKYGLELEVNEPGSDTGPSLPELDQRVRRHVFQTSGMFGAWDLQGWYGNSEEINASGLYGELMRTIYRLRTPLDTPEQAIDHIQNRMGWDRQKLLRPHVRETVNEKLAAWAEAALSRGWTPRGLLDLLYADMRIRRWVGTAEEANLNATANLLQLKECIVAGFVASPEARLRDELHYRLIERLDPSLLTVPLASAQWNPALAPPDSSHNPPPAPFDNRRLRGLADPRLALTPPAHCGRVARQRQRSPRDPRPRSARQEGVSPALSSAGSAALGHLGRVDLDLGRLRGLPLERHLHEDTLHRTVAPRRRTHLASRLQNRAATSDSSNPPGESAEPGPGLSLEGAPDPVTPTLTPAAPSGPPLSTPPDVPLSGLRPVSPPRSGGD